MQHSTDNTLGSLTFREFFSALKGSMGVLIGGIIIFVFIHLIKFDAGNAGLNEIFDSIPNWSITALLIITAFVFPQAASKILKDIGIFINSMAGLLVYLSPMKRFWLLIAVLIFAGVFFISPLAGFGFLIYIDVLHSEIKNKISERTNNHPHPEDDNNFDIDPYS